MGLNETQLSDHVDDTLNRILDWWFLYAAIRKSRHGRGAAVTGAASWDPVPQLALYKVFRYLILWAPGAESESVLMSMEDKYGLLPQYGMPVHCVGYARDSVVQHSDDLDLTWYLDLILEMQEESMAVALERLGPGESVPDPYGALANISFREVRAVRTLYVNGIASLDEWGLLAGGNAELVGVTRSIEEIGWTPGVLWEVGKGEGVE